MFVLKKIKRKYSRWQKAGKEAIIDGPISRALFAIALPIVLTNIMHAAYGFIDAFWVGRLGGEAVAAVSICFPITFFLMTIGAGFAIAGSTLAAHHVGSGSREAVDRIASQALLLACTIGTFFTLAGYFAAPYVLDFLNVEPHIYASALTYLRASMLTLICSFIFSTFQALMRGTGEVMFPLMIVFITVVLNFILDPMLIFGWGPIPPLGVSGAAYATLATQTIAALAALTVLMRGKAGIKVSLHDLTPNFQLIGRIVRLGYPASIEQAARSIGMNAMLFITTGFGTIAVAAYGVGSNVLRFVFIPGMGLSFATATLVGQNIGASNPLRAQRIARFSALLAFVSFTVIGMFAFVFAGDIMYFFVPGDTEVIVTGKTFIQIAGLAFGFMGVQQALAGAFRGAGDTKAAMAVAIVLQGFLQFPLAFILSRYTMLGLKGIFWAFPISFIVSACVTMIWFMRGGWLTKHPTQRERFEEQVTEEIISEEGQ